MNFQNNKNLAQVSELMIDQKLTIATAESCTAGLLQYVFSQADNAMTLFQGGMTVYNSGQKAKQLNVNPVFAEECNSVSKEIAEKMALEIALKFNSEMGVSITGYAQPIPEDDVTNCYAYIAISKVGKVALSKKIFGDAKKSLAENQEIYAEKILKELVKILKS